MHTKYLFIRQIKISFWKRKRGDFRVKGVSQNCINKVFMFK